MKTFDSRIASALALAALAALAAMLHAAPAGAMGHAGIPASTDGSRAAERQGPAEAGTQAQIDALRKEMDEIKERMAMAQARAAEGAGR